MPGRTVRCVTEEARSIGNLVTSPLEALHAQFWERVRLACGVRRLAEHIVSVRRDAGRRTGTGALPRAKIRVILPISG